MARFLALDWDQNQLHVIAAEIGKRTVRVQRAKVWQEGQTPNPANAEDMGRLLATRLAEAGIKPAPLLACLGRDRLIIKQIRFPQVPEADEPVVVRFQALKELTDAPDDVIIDYVITGQAGGEQKASALVIRREIADVYRRVAEAAGMKLVGLTPRLQGVITTLRRVMGTTVLTPPPEPADSTICAVSVGEVAAEILVLRGDTALLARSVPVGSNLTNEIRRNLSVHRGQAPQHPVKAVYVTGKDSGELQLKLGGMLEEPVYAFDPFAEFGGVAAPAEDAPSRGRAGAGVGGPVLPPPGKGSFAGAMGLLYLKANEANPVNFVSPRQPKPTTNPNYRYLRLAVVAAVVLFIGLIVLGRVVHASRAEELAALLEDRERLEKQLTDSRENGKRLKAIDDWDNVVILDEIYDLTARITDVNSLRITSFSKDAISRNPKSKFVAKATIKGKLLSRSQPRKPLDELVTQFTKEGYYSVEPPKVEGDNFTLVVFAERRAPEQYKYLISEEKLKAPEAAEEKEEGEGEEEEKGKDKGKDKAKGKFGEKGRGGMFDMSKFRKRN